MFLQGAWGYRLRERRGRGFTWVVGCGNIGVVGGTVDSVGVGQVATGGASGEGTGVVCLQVAWVVELYGA